jgi:transposase
MDRQQIVLFQTSIEDRIPHDHPVRLLDEILEELDWSAWENTYDGGTGQPPIHPAVLCKVLLFAMTRRLRSSRAIEYSIRHSIDFMWLVSGRTIDHTTISEFRRKHQSQIKDIHRQMIRTAVDMGLARLSELCIDGTRVLADANRYKTWTAARVEKLLAELDGQIDTALAELETNDSIDDLLDDGQKADRLPPELADLQHRQAKMKEVLAQLQQMDARRKFDGIDPQKNPAQLPKTDLDARILPNKEGGYAPNYTPLAVNEMLNGFIVDSDVVIGNVEHFCMTTMVETIAADHVVNVDHAVDVNTVMADSAYSCGDNLTQMEEREIELLSPLAEQTCENNPAVRDDPTLPVPDADLDRLPVNRSTKVFDKSAFVYDEDQDCYFCPAGKTLSRRGQETKQRGDRQVVQINYRSDACAGCPLAERCRKNPDARQGRKVTHDEHESARRRHRARMNDPESQERYKARQHFGETPFAVLKVHFDLRRFLLRGIAGVQTEWSWACAAFNLKKLMTLIARLRAAEGALAHDWWTPEI